MALTMLEKTNDHADRSAWPADIAAEFERERQNNNGCVGNMLLSENERVRVWMIRLAPGERFGFHRHVLDYSGPTLPAGAPASMSMTARRSNIPISRARRGTKPTEQASSRFTIWKISATKRWSS